MWIYLILKTGKTKILTREIKFGKNYQEIIERWDSELKNYKTDYDQLIGVGLS